MRYSLILILIMFSCKQEKIIDDPNKNKNVSINKNVKKAQNEIVLDAIKSLHYKDTLIFQLENSSILFVNKKDECWRNIQIKDSQTGLFTEIQKPVGICFEKNRVFDFSPDQRFLVLHAIEKGEVLNGSSVEYIEKYSCMFLDIERKVISERYSDLICSGEWKDFDQWFIDNEEYYEAEELFSE